MRMQHNINSIMQDLAKQQSNSYNKNKKPQTSAAADEGFNPVIISPSESINSGINDAIKVKIDESATSEKKQ